MGTSPGSSPTEGADPAAATPPNDERVADEVVVETRPSSDSAQTVEAALAASTRAEATLGALYQAIQQVTQGVSGAREANEQLGTELHRVREMLAASNEQHLVYKNRTALLEHQLVEARGDRDFLIEEQDRFLAGLLEEHEESVDGLVSEREEAFARLEQLMRQSQQTVPPNEAQIRRTNPGLGDANPAMPSVRPPSLKEHDKNVEKLLLERDRSREVVRRLQQQRDDAQKALAEVTSERDRYLSELARIAPARVPAPRPLVSPQDARRTQRAIPHAATRTTDPSPPENGDLIGESIGERMTAPPGGDLSAAIALSRPSPPAGIPAQSTPTNEPKPPLRRKPDPTTQPLGGYSVRSDDDDKGTDGQDASSKRQ